VIKFAYENKIAFASISVPWPHRPVWWAMIWWLWGRMFVSGPRCIREWKVVKAGQLLPLSMTYVSEYCRKTLTVSKPERFWCRGVWFCSCFTETVRLFLVTLAAVLCLLCKLLHVVKK
jgi:hypothetical protein